MSSPINNPAYCKRTKYVNCLVLFFFTQVMCVEFFTKEGFKKTAEKIRDHERTIIKILALLLGFYASTLMRRWWGQVSKLPRLNDVAMVMNAIFQPGIKVLSLLEACFDLILSPFTFHENSNHGRENYCKCSNPPSGRSKFFCSLLFLLSNSSHKTGYL